MRAAGALRASALRHRRRPASRRSAASATVVSTPSTGRLPASPATSVPSRRRGRVRVVERRPSADRALRSAARRRRTGCAAARECAPLRRRRREPAAVPPRGSHAAISGRRTLRARSASGSLARLEDDARCMRVRADRRLATSGASCAGSSRADGRCRARGARSAARLKTRRAGRRKPPSGTSSSKAVPSSDSASIVSPRGCPRDEAHVELVVVRLAAISHGPVEPSADGAPKGPRAPRATTAGDNTHSFLATRSPRPATARQSP